MLCEFREVHQLEIAEVHLSGGNSRENLYPGRELKIRGTTDLPGEGSTNSCFRVDKGDRAGASSIQGKTPATGAILPCHLHRDEFASAVIVNDVHALATNQHFLLAGNAKFSSEVLRDVSGPKAPPLLRFLLLQRRQPCAAYPRHCC